MEAPFKAGMQRVVDNHPSVRQGRAVGLFGAVDLQGPDGNLTNHFHTPPPEPVGQFKRDLLAAGVFGLVRAPIMHWAPPLVVSEDEINDTVDKIDTALYTLDKGLGF